MTVGERVRELRLKRGMSPVALAAAAGVTDSAISQLEQGLTKQPSFATGIRIARALGVTPDELAGLPPPEHAPEFTLQEGNGDMTILEVKQPSSGRLRELEEWVGSHDQILERTLELVVALATATGLPNAEQAENDLRSLRDRR